MIIANLFKRNNNGYLQPYIPGVQISSDELETLIEQWKTRPDIDKFILYEQVEPKHVPLGADMYVTVIASWEKPYIGGKNGQV